MKCQGEGCDVIGPIGTTLLYTEDGMVPGIQMKRHRVLCKDCRDKFLRGVVHEEVKVEPENENPKPEYEYPF